MLVDVYWNGSKVCEGVTLEIEEGEFEGGKKNPDAFTLYLPSDQTRAAMADELEARTADTAYTLRIFDKWDGTTVSGDVVAKKALA